MSITITKEKNNMCERTKFDMILGMNECIYLMNKEAITEWHKILPQGSTKHHVMDIAEDENIFSDVALTFIKLLKQDLTIKFEKYDVEFPKATSQYVIDDIDVSKELYEMIYGKQE